MSLINKGHCKDTQTLQTEVESLILLAAKSSLIPFIILVKFFCSEQPVIAYNFCQLFFCYCYLCVFTGRSLPSNVLYTNHYSFSFFRQMELNPCENGSVKAEINHQEQTFIKSLECLNLATNEGSSDVSVEDHIGEELAGKYVHRFLSRIVTL